jgi:hypothetical protein
MGKHPSDRVGFQILRFQILQPWHHGPIVPAINKTTVYTAYSLLLTVKAGGFAFPLGGFFELEFSCG